MRRAAFTHPTHEHFYLLHNIAARQFYGRNDDFLKANSITATVANKVDMVIPVLSSGTVVFT